MALTNLSILGSVVEASVSFVITNNLAGKIFLVQRNAQVVILLTRVAEIKRRFAVRKRFLIVPWTIFWLIVYNLC